MSKKFYLISLLFYFCALFMSAQNSLRLSPIFASGMVLQQNADVIFWGWGEPNKKVNIFFTLFSVLPALITESRKYGNRSHSPIITEMLV